MMDVHAWMSRACERRGIYARHYALSTLLFFLLHMAVHCWEHTHQGAAKMVGYYACGATFAPPSMNRSIFTIEAAKIHPEAGALGKLFSLKKNKNSPFGLLAGAG